MRKHRGTLVGMRFSKKMLTSFVCLLAIFGCEQVGGDHRASDAPMKELSLMTSRAQIDPPHQADNVIEAEPAKEEAPAEPYPKPSPRPQEPDPNEIIRSSHNWAYAAQLVGYNEDAAPFLLNRHPRITKRTRRHTRELHRQTAAALGLKGKKDKEHPFALFLMTRASIEASEQGNERPLDKRGSVHRLDVAAAWKAGSRLRQGYVDEGNELAKTSPHVWLGYGQGGMNSWLFLKSWDVLGDPRMLADTVIFGLTYARVARKKMHMLNGHLMCPVWDDDGRWMTTSFNGKRYRVGERAIDEEGYNACIDEGPNRHEKPDAHERRCRSENKKSYKWRLGEYQPENTQRIDKVDWWQLKRATNGKPCPPWKGDEYEEHLRKKFEERAARVGFDTTRTVRLKDLGDEPEGIGQYELWVKIWDATMESLGEPPINWENLRTYGSEEAPDFSPSKEKLAEQRALEKDPYALEKKWGRRFKKKE